MDVFIIHSGDDEDKILQKLTEIKKEVFSFNPLLLSTKKKKNDGQLIWRIKARRKIKRAQIVLFFVGECSHASGNIDWEIKQARNAGKPIYTVKLKDDYKTNDVLLFNDKFSKIKIRYDKEYTFENILKLFKDHEKGDYSVFNQDTKELDRALLFEQYKIFLQTSEDLVSRRQSVNNFYISINSALMTVYGIILALDITKVYKLVSVLVLSTVGVILSISWIKLLVSYGNLNSSKMKIITYIEKELPASLYDAEWSALSDTLNKKKYVSFTESEKRIPILFIAVYTIIALCVGAFILH